MYNTQSQFYPIVMGMAKEAVAIIDVVAGIGGLLVVVIRLNKLIGCPPYQIMKSYNNKAAN